MKIKNMIFIILVLVGFTACSYTNPTYEIFVKRYADFQIGNVYVPKNSKNEKQIYNNDEYIYIIEYPENCVVAFITHQDDNPEVVTRWFIVSGKEHCKMTETFILLQ